MKVKLGFPCLLSHPSPLFSPSYNHSKNLFLLLFGKNLESATLSLSKKAAIGAPPRASISETPRNGVAEEEEDSLLSSSSSSCVVVLDEEMISRASRLKEAGEVLEMIAAESTAKRDGGVVTCSDCRRIISAALERNNPDLALSVFTAMRSSSFTQVLKENGGLSKNWKWSRLDLSIYTTLVLGLAASLRVSDALRMVSDICRVGASPGDEVPFGKIVRCPTCLIAVAVAQPQQGIQIVSCAKCRYQYELISGDIVNIDSEEIRISSCRTQHGCSSLEKVAGISSIDEANHTVSCAFPCDPNPFWSCSYS